ncbi:MAG: prepilin-type N-terminal cleavage/methylation domain-containing protein [Candidatus Caenarcaniphilales bacterium]|jgi:prepilin-type N-terminal cleavage/methylation domain-containing protein|nr:prepilin-type N-terminal cleavage/methylation domain-containing protein [Candidatus Caenarcaniphilales bacterium]
MRKISNIRRSEAGLTLVELMVVVVIIGILATIAIPNLMEAQDKAKNANVIAAANALTSNIQIAAVDTGGIIPESTYEVEQVGAIKKLLNPFTKQSIELVEGIVDPDQDMPGTLGYEPNVSLAKPFRAGIDKEPELQPMVGGFVVTGLGVVKGEPAIVVALDNG